jgi:hypothetical protein
MQELETDLPQLAVMGPGSEFTKGVLLSTSLLPIGVREVRIDWKRRISELWFQLLQRPRFSWEAAYVATLVVVLLFGIPGLSQSALRASPLKAVPASVNSALRTVPNKFSTAMEAGSSKIRSAKQRAGVSLEESSEDVATVVKWGKNRGLALWESCQKLGGEVGAALGSGAESVKGLFSDSPEKNDNDRSSEKL